MITTAAKKQKSRENLHLGGQDGNKSAPPESIGLGKRDDLFSGTHGKAKVRTFLDLVHTLLTMYGVGFVVHHVSPNALADEELWLVTFMRKDKRRWRMRYSPMTDGILEWLKARADDLRPTELTFELYRSLNDHGRLAFDDAQGFPTNYYERFGQPADDADIKQAQKQIDFLVVDLLQAGYRDL